MGGTIRCEIDPSGIVTILFNEPGKSVNTLAREVMSELSTTLDALETDSSLRGVIFASGKPTAFLVGADLKKLYAMDQATLDHYIVDGQQQYNRIERLSIPTVAAINGHCLGGGLELALTCRVRIAADNPTALIGLPETAIGLIPAWGGTVRLARLIGYEAAIPLLLGSLKLSPQEALRMGIVDQVVPSGELLRCARQALETASEGEMKDMRQSSPPSCEAAIQEAADRAAPMVSSHDVSPPAVERLIGVLIAACRDGHDAGLNAERRAAVDLFDTPECRQRLERFVNRK